MLFGLAHSSRAAANSAVGLGNPTKPWRTTPTWRFFVPALWRAVRGTPLACRVPRFPGLPTRAQFASLSLGNDGGELQTLE